MLIIIFLFLLILLFTIPIRRAWNSFRHKGEITPNVLTIKKWEGISISVSYFMFWIGLLINAFEHIIEERAPKCHKIIRNFYDKHGYPISKHINTKWSADLIYILMKPLEWFFLLVLYTVEKNPENRIHIQYSELRK